MGKFYLSLTIDFLIEALKLNSDFKVKKANLINDMHFDNYCLELLIEHEDAKEKKPIPYCDISYKEVNGNIRIDKITLDGSNVKFKNIDYCKEVKEDKG